MLKERRELELIKVLIVGAIVGAAVTAAFIIAVSPLGFRDATPEIRGKGIDLLRDCVLIGMSLLVGNVGGRGRPNSSDSNSVEQ